MEPCLGRLLLGLTALLLVACTEETTILGAVVSYEDGGPHPDLQVARAICNAAEVARSIEAISDVQIRVVDEETRDGLCMSSGVRSCWLPASRTVVVVRPGDGCQVSDNAITHELGHADRQAWLGDSDSRHADVEWWARWDQIAADRPCGGVR